MMKSLEFRQIETKRMKFKAVYEKRLHVVACVGGWVDFETPDTRAS